MGSSSLLDVEWVLSTLFDASLLSLSAASGRLFSSQPTPNPEAAPVSPRTSGSGANAPVQAHEALLVKRTGTSGRGAHGSLRRGPIPSCRSSRLRSAC